MITNAKNGITLNIKIRNNILKSTTGVNVMVLSSSLPKKIFRKSGAPNINRKYKPSIYQVNKHKGRRLHFV